MYRSVQWGENGTYGVTTSVLLTFPLSTSSKKTFQDGLNLEAVCKFSLPGTRWEMEKTASVPGVNEGPYQSPAGEKKY